MIENKIFIFTSILLFIYLQDVFEVWLRS